MNILIIGTPNSIHDQKWINFLAKNSNHQFFITGEKFNTLLNDDDKKAYDLSNIKLLKSLPSFSLFKFWKTIKGFIQISRWINNHNIDLVHVIFPTPHLYWTSLIKKPIIVSTRGSDILVVMRGLIEQKSLKHKVLFNLLKRNFLKSNAITCTSELQKDYLIQQISELKDRCSTVRTGIDLKFIAKIETPEKQENHIRIFSPRFFKPIYNIENQIKALKLLPKTLQEKIIFVMVKGRNPDLSYEKKITSLLENTIFKIEIHNYFNKADLIKAYKKSDLVIMTPHSDGTPNSALEAMACKRKLIISNLNYQSPLFKNTCLLANPKSIEDIAQKIEQSIENYPDEYLINAHQSVYEYGNQKKEMEKILTIYDSQI